MAFGTFDEILEEAAHADEFEGKVTLDEEDTQYASPRWLLGVEKEDGYVVRVWSTPRKAATIVNSMRKAGVDLKGKSPAKGELLGVRGIWRRTASTWTDRESGEEKTSRSIVMVKLLGESKSASFDSDDVVNMLTVLDGKKSSEYQRGIMKDPLLSNAAKVGILSGDAQKWLVAEGYAVLEGDVLHSTEKALDLAQR